MPGSPTTPGRPGARDGAPGRVAFRISHCVGTRNRNFRGSMAGLCVPLSTLRLRPYGHRARLGADVDRYSFIVRDLHPLLLAGLPAHANDFRSWPPIADMSGRCQSASKFWLRS